MQALVRLTTTTLNQQPCTIFSMASKKKKTQNSVCP